MNAAAVEFSGYDFGYVGHASGIAVDAAAGIAAAVASNAAEAAVVAAVVDTLVVATTVPGNWTATAVPALAGLESAHESRRD